MTPKLEAIAMHHIQLETGIADFPLRKLRNNFNFDERAMCDAKCLVGHLRWPSALVHDKFRDLLDTVPLLAWARKESHSP